jgi:KaiC/GvpD/RAD55 family RecA-like ATPase
MTQTGVATLHDLLGGALPGRIHLLLGGPGSGKSSACLHFLRAGMLSGERTALITLDRPTDLQSHAKHLGHDLRASVRDGRLTLIRYDAHFAARIAAAATPAAVVAELRQMFDLADLRRMLNGAAPLRIAIDPISPFLSEGVTTGAVLSALMDWLEEMGATALLTWNGDVSGRPDRRMDRLLERAAVIVAFSRVTAGLFRADVVRARHAIANTPPIGFEIRPGFGLAPASATPAERLLDASGISQSVLLGPLTPPSRDDRPSSQRDRGQTA